MHMDDLPRKTRGQRPSVSDVGLDEKLPIGAAVLGRIANFTGWHAGTVVDRTPGGNLRIVFVDGSVGDDVHPGAVRFWRRPAETQWHKKRKVVRGAKKKSAAAEAASLNASAQLLGRAVEQIDAGTHELITRFPNARKAAEGIAWLPDCADVVACCRGAVPEAAGYKWRWAEQRQKIDSADIDGLLAANVAIKIQFHNPKRPATKSHELYDKYKVARTVREMLALGGRRGDVAYDVSHGWITFVDPDIARRYAVN
ncbi:hypothetical protein M885DRAFT_544299 [Pelagophyceae sp. CCMP2097]|nr:hypothetical protein M885DRAFT_544299 [Pelagophyceae sp. CCMP2097]|mmetsp:Transcript_1820/g.6704  ORF Transcript_1820/g.6704 Transcript_1820/m.6704 type:complete len:255 (+) Transcript_1820:36-800(+)